MCSISPFSQARPVGRSCCRKDIDRAFAVKADLKEKDGDPFTAENLEVNEKQFYPSHPFSSMTGSFTLQGSQRWA
jgi:hypothetical protein